MSSIDSLVPTLNSLSKQLGAIESALKMIVAAMGSEEQPAEPSGELRVKARKRQ